MNNDNQKRTFDRHAIDFEIEVIGKDHEGNQFGEKSKLKDVSGNGLLFASKLVDKYFIGQLLKLTVYLPYAGKYSASLHGDAKVVRIVPSTCSSINKDDQENSIAVTLDDSLNYFQDDTK